MEKNIKLWWSDGPAPGNMGDILSPVILKKLGYQIERVQKNTSGKLNAIGSTAKFIMPNDIVWGTGIMRDSDPIERNATYLAVRGPLTGEKVNCSVYGDPALLCSKLFPMPKASAEITGFIPHYVDYGIALENKINILNKDPLEVVKKLTQCSKVISTSLHGIILAHAYGIPAAWWRASDKLNGDDSKFQDYALSVGIELPAAQNLSELVYEKPEQRKIEEIQENLIDVLV